MAETPVVNSTNLASCLVSCTDDPSYTGYYASNGGYDRCVKDCRDMHSSSALPAPAAREQDSEEKFDCGGWSLFRYPASLAIGKEECECPENAKSADDCKRTFRGLQLGLASRYNGDVKGVSIQVFYDRVQNMNGFGLTLVGQQNIEGNVRGASILLLGDQNVGGDLNGFSFSLGTMDIGGGTEGVCLNLGWETVGEGHRSVLEKKDEEISKLRGTISEMEGKLRDKEEEIERERDAARRAEAEAKKREQEAREAAENAAAKAAKERSRIRTRTGTVPSKPENPGSKDQNWFRRTQGTF